MEATDEEVSLGSLALPQSLVKRLVKSTVPGYRFNSDALAGLNRVAQAFVCFVTDRSLMEVHREQTSKAKKGSKPPVLRKTLSADHVLRFLQQDMPQLASKLCSLFPESVPEDFKPSSVTLLQQLHEQIQARAAVDSLEVPDSFPDFAEMKEVPQVPVEDPDEAKTTKKGAKKRKAEKNAEATETAPKKAARSLSAFFTKAGQGHHPEEADGNDEQIREMPETEC